MKPFTESTAVFIVFGMFFFLLDHFFFCLSLNRSINNEYNKEIYIYSERVKILVLGSLE